MSGNPHGGGLDALRAQRTEPFWLRVALIGTALLFLACFLGVPLVAVFTEAFRRGLSVYLQSLVDPAALSAIRLSLFVTIVAVPMNVVFGLMAAWAIARFPFRGKSLLLTLIDLPFSISPVVVGLMLVLLFGMQGLLGPALRSYDIDVIFAVPGILIATIFVTFPFVARELIPLMQQQGAEEEEAAVLLGANRWQLFWRITLPNVRWGLLYGVVLSTARALGEFGAVSVVSGHIRGRTNTIPLHVEILYNEYNFSAAFAVASLLTLFALLTILMKSWLEWRIGRERSPSAGEAQP
ncbi:MAG: sulfate ABC transporter permease subunit CysW [Bryobacterales bacterium]|nr:sulfate ABC transporter permease subunit CysW [Bryobacterales bacterium]